MFLKKGTDVGFLGCNLSMKATQNAKSFIRMNFLKKRAFWPESLLFEHNCYAQLINFVNVSGSEKDDRCWFSWAVTFKWKRISPFRLTLQNPSFKGISKKNKCSCSGFDKKRNHYKAHKKSRHLFTSTTLCNLRAWNDYSSKSCWRAHYKFLRKLLVIT